MGLSDLPISFWGHTLLTAALTLNRAPSKAVEKTPYELWTKKPPRLSFLKIWGCEAYVKKLISDKLHPKSDKVYFVGYPKETKGYYFYNKSENKVFVARDGVFLEKKNLSKMTSGRKIKLDEVREDEQQGQVDNQSAHEASVDIGQSQNMQSQTDNANAQSITLRRSTRPRSQPDIYLGVVLTEDQDILVVDGDEPATYKQAMTSPDSAKWQEAMKFEMDRTPCLKIKYGTWLIYPQVTHLSDVNGFSR